MNPAAGSLSACLFGKHYRSATLTITLTFLRGSPLRCCRATSFFTLSEMANGLPSFKWTAPSMRNCTDLPASVLHRSSSKYSVVGPYDLVNGIRLSVPGFLRLAHDVPHWRSS